MQVSRIWGCQNTQNNGIQLNGTQHNDVQYNDTQAYDIQHDTKKNDTQAYDIQHNDAQNNEIQHNNTQRLVPLYCVAFLLPMLKIVVYAECYYAKYRYAGGLFMRTIIMTECSLSWGSLCLVSLCLESLDFSVVYAGHHNAEYRCTGLLLMLPVLFFIVSECRSDECRGFDGRAPIREQTTNLIFV